MPPHPHHSRTRHPTPPRGQPELHDCRSPCIGPCPSLPTRGGPGTPPRSRSAAARRCLGTAGRRWGRGLLLRAPVDPSSSPSPPPSSFAASRASSSPVVSWDQLIRVNFTQLRLTGRHERCSPGREERERVEPDTCEGGGRYAQLPGKCSSPEAYPSPHPGSEGPEGLQFPVSKRLLLRGGGAGKPSSVSGVGVFALTVVSAGFRVLFWQWP